MSINIDISGFKFRLTAELHDEFRGVNGSFERAVNGALEIRAHGYYFERRAEKKSID